MQKNFSFVTKTVVISVSKKGLFFVKSKIGVANRYRSSLGSDCYAQIEKRHFYVFLLCQEIALSGNMIYNSSNCFVFVVSNFRKEKFCPYSWTSCN